MKNYLIGCKTDKGMLWIQHPGLSTLYTACNIDACSAEDLQVSVQVLASRLKTKFKYIDLDEVYDGKDDDALVEIELYDSTTGNLLETA